MKARPILMWWHTSSPPKLRESWWHATQRSLYSSLMKSTDNGRPNKASPGRPTPHTWALSCCGIVGHRWHHSKRNSQQQGATPTASIPPGRWGRNCASSSTGGPVTTALVANSNTCVPPVGAAVTWAVTIRPHSLHQPWWRLSTRAAMPRIKHSRHVAPR